MEFIDTITLTSWQSALVGLICFAIVLKGRPEIALGMYLSIAGWTRIVYIGSYVHTWLLLATIIGATLVYLLRRSNLALLPLLDRWIVAWMLVWWAWILLLIWLFAPDTTLVLLRSLLLYQSMPLPFILLFGRDIRRIMAFVISFTTTTIIGGLLAIAVLGLSLQAVIADPSLEAYKIIRLNIVNYHLLAYDFAISLVFVIALFYVTRHILVRGVLGLCVAYCTYFLVLLGSRQAMVGIVISVPIFLLWVALRSEKQRLSAIFMIATIAIVGIALYILAPVLIIRNEQSNLAEAFDVTASRGEYWLMAWNTFLQSPIWGVGFTRFIYSHNIFIGALSDQGIVGLTFLIGFLIFVIGRIRNVWVFAGRSDQELWRMVFVCIVIFSISHSQASGSAITTWHLYWASAFLWVLEDKVTEKIFRRPQPFEASSLELNYAQYE